MFSDPGSTPRTRKGFESTGLGADALVVHFQVGVHVLNVFMIFEEIQKLQARLGLLACELDSVLRFHDDRRLGRLDAGGLDGSLNGVERFGGTDDLESIVARAEVLGTRFELDADAGTAMNPRFSNIQATLLGSARFPPCLENRWRISGVVRIRLSVSVST